MKNYLWGPARGPVTDDGFEDFTDFYGTQIERMAFAAIALS